MASEVLKYSLTLVDEQSSHRESSVLKVEVALFFPSCLGGSPLGDPKPLCVTLEMTRFLANKTVKIVLLLKNEAPCRKWSKFFRATGLLPISMGAKISLPLFHFKEVSIQAVQIFPSSFFILNQNDGAKIQKSKGSRRIG